MSIRERHSTTRRGTRKWLTAKDMNERFGEEMAQAIRDRKLYDPDLKRTETRFHPELPGVEARPLHDSTWTLQSKELLLRTFTYFYVVYSIYMHMPDLTHAICKN